MKIERILYYLSERVYGLFSTLFFLDLLGMGILYCLDIKYNMFFRDLFFSFIGIVDRQWGSFVCNKLYKKNRS